MNEIQIFKNEQFGQIRVIQKDGQPWFVAKDIAEILEYTDAEAMCRRIDDDDQSIATSQNLQNVGFEIPTRGLKIINESGFYSAILGSKKPEAKKFKHWVTSEVLPSIRKHGAYMTPEKLEEALLNPDAMIKILTALKQEREEKKLLQEKIEKDKPKVEFAEHVAISNNSLLVREVAKIISKNGIEIGEQRLYKKLRDWGWVFKNSCEATQYAIAQGYMEVSETVKETSKGKFTFKTSRVTGKGQMRIFEKLKEDI